MATLTMYRGEKTPTTLQINYKTKDWMLSHTTVANLLFRDIANDVSEYVYYNDGIIDDILSEGLLSRYHVKRIQREISNTADINFIKLKY